MPVCFVPGCKSGLKSCNEKRRFFPPPVDSVMKEKWDFAISRSDTVLRHKSKVCDIHFDGAVIDKGVTLLHPDGSEEFIPKMRWKLHPDAVPTLHLDNGITTSENGTISDNIIYHVCGYMVYKYRKLKCKACLDSINLDLDLLPEVLTKEKLTLLKTKGKLKLASNSFFRLVSLVESALLTFCITDNVLVKGAFEEVMNSTVCQDLPRVGCDEHYEQFVCNAIYDYLLLRFKAIASRKKQEKFELNSAKRHANRKMSKI